MHRVAGVPLQVVARCLRHAHAHQRGGGGGAVSDEGAVVIPRPRLHGVAALVDQHVRRLRAQHVDQRRIRQRQADAAQARLPLRGDLVAERVEGAIANESFHVDHRRGRQRLGGIDARFTEGEGDHDVLRRARRQRHVVAQLAGRQAAVVVRLLRIGQRIGHQQAGDLVLAMRTERRGGRARHRRQRLEQRASVDCHLRRVAAADGDVADRRGATVLPRRTDLHGPRQQVEAAGDRRGAGVAQAVAHQRDRRAALFDGDRGRGQFQAGLRRPLHGGHRHPAVAQGMGDGSIRIRRARAAGGIAPNGLH